MRSSGPQLAVGGSFRFAAVMSIPMMAKSPETSSKMSGQPRAPAVRAPLACGLGPILRRNIAMKRINAFIWQVKSYFQVGRSCVGRRDSDCHLQRSHPVAQCSPEGAGHFDESSGQDCWTDSTNDQHFGVFPAQSEARIAPSHRARLGSRHWRRAQTSWTQHQESSRYPAPTASEGVIIPISL